jgi:UDP-N-acetylglucosamine diphosphorylase / glucose-1-phosphate thymidylyltransferase / UDP-N-acetylgalactosamine diphosphorylase / glucosamine-1-phosphate N-acetyltransferase / galactosamine-1-phosphate N-acetyltransferase
MDISRFTDIHCREQLMPFTLTRHAAEIRVGMFTIKEKWELALTLFPGIRLPQSIPADIIPGQEFFALLNETGWENAIAETQFYRILHHPWDITRHNDWAIRQDFVMAVKGRETSSLSSTVKITGRADLFLEKDVVAEHCFINTTGGPVYISEGVEIMEGAMLRGPLFIGKGSVIKMGAAIYGATSIGPDCLVGGEIKNSMLFGYSNKAHEGYLGDSVLGEWCNLGAGTTCSNIRNNASAVKVWDMKNKTFIEAGLKCGLLMGDYSRSSINSSFNTGTIVGVSANIFQPGGLLPKYIPSFSWGATTEIKYTFDKALADINNWMNFKNHSLSEDQINTLQHIFSLNDTV